MAIERFIDDVSVLAVENCFIGKLPELFKPQDVAGLSPEDISRLAREAEETSFARNALEQKRKTLMAGLQRLKTFNIDRALSRAASQDAEVTEDTSDEDTSDEDTSDEDSVCLEEVSALSLSGEDTPVATSQDDSVDDPFAQPDQDDGPHVDTATGQEMPETAAYNDFISRYPDWIAYQIRRQKGTGEPTNSTEPKHV